MSNIYNLVVGIDEAGRGPLAGPVTVGAFAAEREMGKLLLKNIFDNKLRDSKKLSPQKREEIYKKFCVLKKDPTSLKLGGARRVFFSVSHISNKIIDKKGISFAIKKGISNCLKNLELEIENCKLKILLDGSLKAPPEYKNQKTIIGGDARNVFIACASIAAKVSRDRLMRRLGSQEPRYAFEIHKGYGTRLHRELIQKHGISKIHRKSFCQKLIK